MFNFPPASPHFYSEGDAWCQGAALSIPPGTKGGGRMRRMKKRRRVRGVRSFKRLLCLINSTGCAVDGSVARERGHSFSRWNASRCAFSALKTPLIIGSNQIGCQNSYVSAIKCSKCTILEWVGLFIILDCWRLIMASQFSDQQSEFLWPKRVAVGRESKAARTFFFSPWWILQMMIKACYSQPTWDKETK